MNHNTTEPTRRPTTGRATRSVRRSGTLRAERAAFLALLARLEEEDQPSCE